MCGGVTILIASSRGLWRDLFDAISATFFRMCRGVDTYEAKVWVGVIIVFMKMGGVI